MGAYLLKAGGGGLLFDVVTGETHTIQNEITEHPVESGANVTDHVRSMLDTISLEVFVSNTPTMFQDRFFGQDIGEYRAVPIAPPGNEDARISELAATVIQWENPVNNVSETYRLLRKWRDDAELLTVVTPLWDYTNMLIREVSVPRTAKEGTGAKMTIELKQIRLVEVRLVPTPIPTEVRGKKSSDKGAKNGKEDTSENQKKSVAASALDALVGMF